MRTIQILTTKKITHTMRSRTDKKSSIELTANVRKLCAIFDGVEQPQGVFTLTEEDMRSMHLPDEHVTWNAFFSLFLHLLREKKINEGLQIELTEHAAGISFAGIEELEKYLIENGFPKGVNISIAVNRDSHPMIKNKALRLERMFSHHDPYERLVDYLRNPASDATLIINKGMREKYDSQHGSLIKDFVSLVKSGLIPPRCDLVFRVNTILNEREAKEIYDALAGAMLPKQFHLYITSRSKDGSDISDLQNKIYHLIHARRWSDNDAAFAAFMKAGFFDQKCLNPSRTVCHKGVTEKIYHYVNQYHDEPYVRAAELQNNRIHERIQWRRTCSLFKAVAEMTGAFALSVGVLSLMKSNK